MLDCNSNCNEDSGKLSLYDIVASEGIVFNNIVINKGDNIISILNKFDQVITELKNQNIEIFYNDIETSGDCLHKELVTDELTQRKKIVLSLDSECIVEESGCGCGSTIEDDFIITSNKYSICGLQTATLESSCTETTWYNQNNQEVGTGQQLIVSISGTYYAKCQGKTSNLVVISKQSNCENYVYTKRKLFYKQCATGYVGTAIDYSKDYVSVISYSDAQFQAQLDEVNFNNEGQSLANVEGDCIYKCPTPTSDSGFNVYLSNAKCTNLPIPIPVPVPVSPTPVPTVPVPTCSINIQVSNIQC